MGDRRNKGQSLLKLVKTKKSKELREFLVQKPNQKTTSKHIIIKLLKTNNEEQFIAAIGGKKDIYAQRKKGRADFSSETT